VPMPTAIRANSKNGVTLIISRSIGSTAQSLVECAERALCRF
jgi:hypothetical protein